MEQRLSLITLGVRDVSRAQGFYEALGWHLDGGVDDETDHVAFFQTPGLIVALWDRAKLAQDSGVTDTGGWGAATRASSSTRRPPLGGGAQPRMDRPRRRPNNAPRRTDALPR